MTDRRRFLQSLALLWTSPEVLVAQPPAPVLDVRPTPLYLQPDGRRNLVRIMVRGLSAPAARARVIDRRGALAGTAGLLPGPDGQALIGEVPLPLSEASTFQVDVEVGRDRVTRRRVRLSPPRRWTLHLLSSAHTDIGYTDLQERTLEIHRRNLDAALARTARGSSFRWTAECAVQVLSYLENRSEEAGEALLAAVREGKIGFQALFANLLTGLLDHETLARAVLPAASLARQEGLTYAAAQITDVPGQTLTFPMALAASGVRYLVSGSDAERAVPLLTRAQADRYGIRGTWTAYPQLYWWEGPDGSRILHWRGGPHGDAARFGFSEGVREMAARLSEWLDTDPLLLSPAWPYDTALIVGLDARPNVPAQDQTVTHIEEFNRRYAFPRIVAGRVEDFFRDLERRYVTRIPVRRGDTGLYHEDGAGSQAAALALFRRTQLAARAADILALWNERLEVRTEHEADRRALWRDVLLFGEHTWGADVSVAEPTSRATVAQWAYKLRFLESASAAAQRSVSSALRRMGSSTEAGAGRVVFNASGWERTDVVRIPGGAGKIFSHGGRELPGVDSGDGSCFVVVRDVPALGYLALIERERAPLMAADEGTALEAEAGGFRARLDPRTGAIASLSGPDRRERVKPGSWSGLNHLVYVTGGARSSMWTSTDGRDLRNAAALETASAELVSARRERLPGIGIRLVAERRVAGCSGAVSTVTLYDECPWVDIENRLIKIPTLEKEALYAAFPFALTRPTVEVEVPLGRMTVEQDQQPGSCRDWYCHAHWVWLHEAADGVLWSAPDTPLVTLNDIFRGEWRRRIEPDGTLFAYILNNYWPTNYAASQHGEVVARFRVSMLAPGDPAEPVRRGWAACDPLYVSDPFNNASNGPLLSRDRALAIADRNVLVVNAKPADDEDGAVVRLLDIVGASRSVTVWPAAYGFRLARRTNLVERNEGPVSVGPDGGAAIDVRAWGLACARLFTSREGAG